jgi:hypothetical protein
MDAYHDALANDYDGLRSIKRRQYGSFRFIWIQQFRNKAALSREESIRRIEQASWF